MSLTDYDSIAMRIAQLVLDAHHMNKPRDLILAEITDFGNELLDERDAILERMEKDFHDDRLFLSAA
jgi:hypothetical protein